MLGAVEFGHAHFQPVIQAIIELAEHAAKEPWDMAEPAPELATLKARLDEVAARRWPRPTARCSEAGPAGQGQRRQEGRPWPSWPRPAWTPTRRKAC